MKNTLIEWAHHTVNFWWGCTFARFADGTIRPECIHCYAKMMAALFSRGKATWAADGARWIRHEAALRELSKLDQSAYDRGVRERVFINSMSDTFEDRADLDAARAVLWDACQAVTNLDILLLTKRPQNVRRMVPDWWLAHWPANVWVGTTVGTQKAADEMLAPLLAVPAAIRFLSVEPLTEAVQIDSLDGIHWVIVGGESGGKARPMHPDWARSLRDQCASAGVAFLFKQWGEWTPGENLTKGGRLRCAWWQGEDCGFDRWIIGTQTDKQSESAHRDDQPDVYRVGKEAAGRLLDGRTHDDVPCHSNNSGLPRSGERGTGQSGD